VEENSFTRPLAPAQPLGEVGKKGLSECGHKKKGGGAGPLTQTDAYYGTRNLAPENHLQPLLRPAPMNPYSLMLGRYSGYLDLA